jgi:hypothetical protein
VLAFLVYIQKTHICHHRLDIRGSSCTHKFRLLIEKERTSQSKAKVAEAKAKAAEAQARVAEAYEKTKQKKLDLKIALIPQCASKRQRRH